MSVIRTSERRRRTLLRGGFLYAADAANTVIPDGWLLIEGEHVAALGPSHTPAPEADREVEAAGKLVLPGFVNAHWHESFVAPCHERPDDLGIARTPYACGGDIEALSAMFAFIGGVGARLTEEEGLAIARFSLFTQLRSGTTALGDLGSANRSDAMARAAIELGMRLRVSRWGADVMIRRGAARVERVADAAAQADDWLALMEAWEGHASGLVGGMPSVMGAFGSSDEQLRALHDVAQRYPGAPYATHLAPLRNEEQALRGVFGKSAVERFDAFGLLTARLLAVHTAYANEAEYRLLRARDVKLCHAPAHYGMLGEASISETRALGRLLRDGVPVSTSTDGDITYVGGMPEAMRAAHLGHNEALNDNTACPPTLALKSGTAFGALALGWADRIGSLEPGKQADIVLVDCDDFRYRLGNHPLRTFLVCGSSKDVHSVFVAGERVIADGKSTRFDEAELLADYRKAVDSARARIAPPR